MTHDDTRGTVHYVAVREPEERLRNPIVLTGKDGKTHLFDFLDTVMLDGRNYMVVLPLTEEENGDLTDDGEVVVFRCGPGAGFTGADPREAERVYEAFKRQAGDEFDFA